MGKRKFEILESIYLLRNATFPGQHIIAQLVNLAKWNDSVNTHRMMCGHHPHVWNIEEPQQVITHHLRTPFTLGCEVLNLSRQRTTNRTNVSTSMKSAKNAYEQTCQFWPTRRKFIVTKLDSYFLEKIISRYVCFSLFSGFVSDKLCSIARTVE